MLEGFVYPVRCEPPSMTAENNRQLNRRILSVVMFTFVCYLTIGLPLAVLPGFVHDHLGYNSVLAGLIISAQYFATLFSRPHAGRYADQLGPKKVVLFGLACCGASGLFYALAFGVDGWPWLSLLLLCVGRVFLGVGESFASTGSTLWGIGRIWAHGLGLAMGTVGFCVIATFITLYYADKGWSGAAFSLTLFSCAFVGIRLIFSNVINRHGGLKVTLASFLVEIVGLLLIWQAGEPWMVQTGALLAGAGFSLVFPALGVEAVKQVPPQNQGTALGTYSAFLDLALGINGPLAGLLIGQAGVPSIYLAAALLVALGVLLTLRLLQRSRV